MAAQAYCPLSTNPLLSTASSASRSHCCSYVRDAPIQSGIVLINGQHDDGLRG